MSARTRKALTGYPRTRRKTPASGGVSPWVWLGLLGAGAWALLRSGKANAATPAGLLSAPANPGAVLQSMLPIQAGTQNSPELPGERAVSQPLVAGSASFWDTLLAGPSIPAGWINFPSGSQAAATLFQTRYDVYGSPYVQWAGLSYILTGPDASGNYTATQVMTG
jgi:hypothetical protein